MEPEDGAMAQAFDGAQPRAALGERPGARQAGRSGLRMVGLMVPEHTQSAPQAVATLACSVAYVALCCNLTPNAGHCTYVHVALCCTQTHYLPQPPAVDDLLPRPWINLCQRMP